MPDRWPVKPENRPAFQQHTILDNYLPGRSGKSAPPGLRIANAVAARRALAF
jgi:hypothetical protein